MRAIGREESLADFDLEPTPVDLCARVNEQLSAFPNSALRLFLPQDPGNPEELYLSFEGLGAGAYRMLETDPLEFAFIGQPLFKDVGRYRIQFPKKMPKLNPGSTVAYDEPTAYSPRFYYPLLAAYGTLSAADLAAARKASPKAAGAMDLAVFLRDWKAGSEGLSEAEKRIESENRWVLGEDPFGIVMDVVGIGGILSTLWGLVDWGISGTFGERQSWEVWGGLGALASYYAVYMPIGYFLIKPIYESATDKKIEEMKRGFVEKSRAQAAAMREKYPEDVVVGRPKGAEGK